MLKEICVWSYEKALKTEQNVKLKKKSFFAFHDEPFCEKNSTIVNVNLKKCAFDGRK